LPPIAWHIWVLSCTEHLRKPKARRNWTGVKELKKKRAGGVLNCLSQDFQPTKKKLHSFIFILFKVTYMPGSEQNTNSFTESPNSLLRQVLSLSSLIKEEIKPQEFR
jgi:hypothetical protein